jgi:hypothetical protein
MCWSLRHVLSTEGPCRPHGGPRPAGRVCPGDVFPAPGPGPRPGEGLPEIVPEGRLYERGPRFFWARRSRFGWPRFASHARSAFTLPLPGGLSPRPLAIAALPLAFISKSGLALHHLVDGAGGRLLRLAVCRLAWGFPGLPPSACSLKGPFEPTGRLSMTPGFAMVAATVSRSSLCLAAPW